MTTWPLRDELLLAAMPNAAYWARRHTEEVLRDWRLGTDEAFTHRLKLVVSELVTNAVNATGLLTDDERERYSRCPMSLSYLDLAALGQVRLRLSSDARSRVLVEVGDQSDEPPLPQTPDVDSEHGRGLLLVETLCDCWGWYSTDGVEGSTEAPDDKTRKVVWGKLRLCPPPSQRAPERPAKI